MRAPNRTYNHKYMRAHAVGFRIGTDCGKLELLALKKEVLKPIPPVEREYKPSPHKLISQKCSLCGKEVKRAYNFNKFSCEPCKQKKARETARKWKERKEAERRLKNLHTTLKELRSKAAVSAYNAL